MSYRVIQWTSGDVGRRALRAVIKNPLYQLVGVFAYGASKVGKDAAELCGLETATGVRATNDVGALLALKPDVCVYTPLSPDVDHICRLLEAGVNVVTTASFITGRSLGDEARSRIQAAAEKGCASIFGSGINPGFANMIGIVSSQLCDRVEQVRVVESVDTTAYDYWSTEVNVGFGKRPGAPGIAEAAAETTAVFSDAVELIAAALGVELDAITFDMDHAIATADNELGYATIRKGEITAVDGRWRGMVGGKDVIVLQYQWLKGANVEESFKLRRGYSIDIIGSPTIRTNVRLEPPSDWNEGSYSGIGNIATAMPAVNAIPDVVAAKPGIVLQHELPAYGARGFVTSPT